MSIDVITLTASKNYTDKQIEKASIKGVDLSRYVQSVNGITPDENGNVEVAGGSGGAGADGFSPVASVTQTNSGAVITITDKGGTTTATVTNGKDGATGEKGDQGIQGETGAKGDKGDTGANGKDGVSATHRWNGTVLTITSASGTSSADLKGDTGAAGKDGTSVTVKSVSESAADGGSNVVTFSDGKTLTVKNGSKGSTGTAGKTPVRGTDYWTAADIAEIKSYVDEAILGGAW